MNLRQSAGELEMGPQHSIERNVTAVPVTDPETDGKAHIQQLGALFDLLGADPKANIRAIVSQACRILDFPCSLYNRLDKKSNCLVCWAGHNLPPAFPDNTKANGHICYEATIKGAGAPVAIEDISRTAYQESDPYVRQYGIKSYLGYPVRCNNAVVGAMAVIDTRVRKFNRTHRHLISMLAKALSLEEDRLRTDAALGRSKDEFQELYKMMRLLADNVPDLLWAKNMRDRYLFANRAMCDKLIKCSHPDDAIGKTDLFFAQRERDAGHRHTFGETCVNSDNIIKEKKSAGRFIEEGLVRNKHLILDVHKAPFWGPDGSIIGTVGCGRDVTREKQTQKALECSRQRYEDLYNNAPVMLCSMDREDNITSASNLWTESLGFRRDEIIGRPLLDFFTEESRRNALEVWLPRYYKSGRMDNRACHLLGKDGKRINALLSAIAQYDENGDYDGSLAFAVDVTETKKVEQERSRLSNRLQQAQKMEAIATLAGGVAHQFNNALAVILGNLELIQMDGLHDAKLHTYVEPINQAGQKMVQLTGQLLAYARGGKFQTQTVSSHQFVTDTLRIVQHSMAPCVELETDLSEAADYIHVDVTQMQMLLAAILANASEAMESPGIVRIRLKNVDITAETCRHYPGLKPGRHVLLNITDNGKGMDAQTRDRIFEPFFTTKFQGRGLGMAAVYGIVKKHDGYVYVDSQPGRGTSVSIYLPGTSFKETVTEAAEGYDAQKRSGTALVVEDEHLVMEVNRAIVEKLGYHVLEAKSGKEAVRIAEQYDGHIDVALLDVILPDMDGSLIYPKLMAARPDLKVVVCSGYSLDGPARNILDNGAESFIQKPFTVAALSAVLKKVVKPTGDA
jgi:two-component system cell cycle sensor histidine kinase/response regulator CckA